MAGPSTGQLRGGVNTELTVLKIAKSKIPGTLVAVGCGSEGSGYDKQSENGIWNTGYRARGRIKNRDGQATRPAAACTIYLPARQSSSTLSKALGAFKNAGGLCDISHLLPSSLRY